MIPNILFKSLDELEISHLTASSDMIGLTLTNQWCDPENDVLYQLFKERETSLNVRYIVKIDIDIGYMTLIPITDLHINVCRQLELITAEEELRCLNLFKEQTKNEAYARDMKRIKSIITEYGLTAEDLFPSNKPSV
jgi:hypothetical protein